MSAVIVELNTTTQAYNEAQAQYSEYMSHFDWVFEQEDEALFDIYEDIASNKATSLNMSALREARNSAENKALATLSQFAQKFASPSELAEINEALAIADRNIVARRKMLVAAQQLAELA